MKKTTGKKSKQLASKKPGKGVAKKGASGTLRNSRIAKFDTKIDRLGTKKVTTKSLESTTALVRVTARNQISQIFGFMVSADENTVILRTQKKQGSSKPVIKPIPRTQVVSQIGEPGEKCLLWILEEKEIFMMKDTNVSIEANVAHVTDNKTGDTISFPLDSEHVSVQIEYDGE